MPSRLQEEVYSRGSIVAHEVCSASDASSSHRVAVRVRTSHLTSLRPHHLQTCHATCKHVMLPANMSCYLQTCHATYKQIMPPANISCHLQTCQGVCEHVMPPANMSCHLQTFHAKVMLIISTLRSSLGLDQLLRILY